MRALYRKLRERPVKHPRLHMWLHVFIPMGSLLAAWLCLWVWWSPPAPWITLLVLPLWMIASIFWFPAALVAFGEKRMFVYEAVKLEPLQLDDEGPMMDREPGWKTLKATFVLTKGKGRLEQQQVVWVRMAACPETEALELIEASDPHLTASMVARVGNG